jgi:hypothetical protein
MATAGTCYDAALTCRSMHNGMSENYGFESASPGQREIKNTVIIRGV